MYCFYKIKFDSPVRFGAERPGIGEEKADYFCHSDVFFSALCNEVVHLEGKDELVPFIENAKGYRLIIINSLGETIYTSTVTDNSYAAELKNVSDGVYFLKLENLFWFPNFFRL